MKGYTPSFSLIALTALMALGLSACGKKEATTTSAPTAAKTEAAPATGGDKVGVQECDEYIEKYQKCLAGKVPEIAQAALKQGFEQTVTAWRQAAATPEGKTGLTMGCKAALDASKQAMAAYGCDW